MLQKTREEEDKEDQYPQTHRNAPNSPDQFPLINTRKRHNSPPKQATNNNEIGKSVFPGLCCDSMRLWLFLSYISVKLGSKPSAVDHIHPGITASHIPHDPNIPQQQKLNPRNSIQNQIETN